MVARNLSTHVEWLLVSMNAPSIALDAPPGARRPGLEQAIDFVNTTGLAKGRPFEDLPTVTSAIDWLAHAGYFPPELADAERSRFQASPARADAAFGKLRATRAGLRELVDALSAERAPRPDAVSAVNDALRVREAAQLMPEGARIRVVYRREGEPFDQALAAIARAVADELSEGRPERFRVCENDRCRWAFYDRSRPGTRRWCEMASCGNRMKAARHRARQHESAATPKA